MLANDVNQKSATTPGIERKRTRPWRTDDPADTSEALVSLVLALVLIGLAITGSMALGESFVYFRDIFSTKPCQQPAPENLPPQIACNRPPWCIQFESKVLSATGSNFLRLRQPRCDNAQAGFFY